MQTKGDLLLSRLTILVATEMKGFKVSLKLHGQTRINDATLNLDFSFDHRKENVEDLGEVSTEDSEFEIFMKALNNRIEGIGSANTELN